MSSQTGSTTKYGHLTNSDDGASDVHRATDEFPAGKECDLECSDVPDDEDAFGQTCHYEEDSRQRSNPDVTDEIVDELINDSEVREAPGEDWDNRYLFQKRIGDYEWTLVVADDYSQLPVGESQETDTVSEDGEESGNERWVLITIYSNYHGSVGTTNKYFDRLDERRS